MLQEECPGCWVLEFPEPVFEISTFDKFLENFRNFLAQRCNNKEHIAIVVDLTNLNVPPDISIVQRLVAFMSTTSELGLACCKRTVIVTHDTLLRNLLSTVCTLCPPSTPVEIVSSRPKKGEKKSTRR